MPVEELNGTQVAPPTLSAAPPLGQPAASVPTAGGPATPGPSLPAPTPIRGWLSTHDLPSLVRFAAICLELALLLLVIRQFALESRAFSRLALLAFAAFPIHYFLPARFRLPFFLLVSLVAIGVVVGPSQAAWLVSVGLVLVAACRLPVAFAIRAGLVAALAAWLALLRADWIHPPWSPAIWPILGSMFMFRTIAYLYDARHQKAPPSIWHTLSYFFLLPNPCFPLFPVVDFAAFRRTYYDDDPHRIYQTGVQWIFRGILHLILYRFVYYYVSVSPAEVADLGDLLRYMVSGFLLYLRLSGQFHIIVGILHLFGFNLPETNHLYFLATGFTDLWRRINIYWKDFMMKVFFYPSFFRLRRLGPTAALVASTLFVFVVTWFLHSYQWFWIRGAFLLAWNDVVFWTILALLVVASSLYEAAYGRRRTLTKPAWTFRTAVVPVLRALATFSLMCVLWSLWTSESLSSWVALLGTARHVTPRNPKIVPALLLGATAFLAAGLLFQRREFAAAGRRRFAFSASVGTILAAAGALYLVGLPGVYARFGPAVAGLVADVRSPRLSRADAAVVERGYYENLLAVERFNPDLWEAYTKRPLDWPNLRDTPAMRETGDFLIRELTPDYELFFHGQRLRTNRWGMRDKDCDQARPPGTCRLAILGSSYTMGAGVADQGTFENRLEGMLNQASDRPRGTHFDALNFGVWGYGPLQHLALVENKVLQFQPSALLYIAHHNDPERTVFHLAECIRTPAPVPYEFLRDVVARAGVTPQSPRAVAETRLRPFATDIVSWVYRRIADGCRQRGVRPVWGFLPRTEFPLERDPELVRLAEQAGFTILDLADAYQGQDTKTFFVAEWDSHPNPEGHALIAEALYRALRKTDVLLSPEP